MSKTTDFLNNHQSATPSRWRENAQWRKDNGRWLSYSRTITLKIMQAMDEQAVTQAVLAERMGCTQQYVSTLLRGSSNMTLETISRIEDALKIDILQSALSSVFGYFGLESSRERYLSDGETPKYGKPFPDHSPSRE